MRFKQYINEYAPYKKVGRGKEITEDQALKLAPKFSQAIKSALAGNPLIERMTDVKYNYYLIDPKKGEPRVSANTLNYYTLVMDNSKRWSKYPKRSQSLIASIKNTPSKHYYILLPKNGAKIGVAKYGDLWISFNDMQMNMSNWNYDLNYLLNINSKKEKRFDGNISEFKKACKNFDEWFKEQNDSNKNQFRKNLNNRGVKWLDDWKGEPLYNYIDNLLEPKSNGFQLTNINNLPRKHNEVWTDSESLMILGSKLFEEYLSKVKI